MHRTDSIQALATRSRHLPWLVIALALAVLGGTILLARQQLRARIREQLAARDGEVLQAVALMHLHEEAVALEQPDAVFDPGTQWTAMLKSSRLRGVLAQRLFTPAGEFLVAVPEEVVAVELLPEDLAALRALKPVNRFWPAAPLADIFLPVSAHAPVTSEIAPVLEVNVPLLPQDGGRLAGIAQFLVHAPSLAGQFAALDRNLFRQSLAAFVVGGGLLAGVLAWTFARLRRVQRTLAARTEDLLQANQELALAARTSALGAVSAHLVHGLKNPLAGLQNFVSQLDSGGGDTAQAVATTRRMQTLIHQVVGVLREESAGHQYEITLEELRESLAARMQPLASECGVRLESHCEGGASLTNRIANLLTLILANLLENAIQATPRGRRVALNLKGDETGLHCEVADEGPGLPSTVRAALFTPCASTKESGSGLGLAISKQLANHLGASLSLTRSDSTGCRFMLRLPASALNRA